MAAALPRKLISMIANGQLRPMVRKPCIPQATRISTKVTGSRVGMGCIPVLSSSRLSARSSGTRTQLHGIRLSDAGLERRFDPALSAVHKAILVRSGNRNLQMMKAELQIARKHGLLNWLL